MRKYVFIDPKLPTDDVIQLPPIIQTRMDESHGNE